jgi:type IV secretory pathway VirB4 component
MDAKDFAQELRDIVDELKTKGVESISSENLIKYLDEALRDISTSARPSEATIERYKAELQKWVEEHKNIHAQGVEMFRSVIQAGQNALRTAFLMNGGASVALLAFVGHLSSVAPERVSTLAPSLTVFVGGVLVAALASGVTYLSQWFYAGERS